ncbi:Structural component of the gap junction, partial [Halocaridina rubra]
MHDVFKKIRHLMKLDSIVIDNVIFRFHYKVTMVFLVAFSLLVTSRQYFGDPIDCIVEGVNRKTIDIYCWFHSTFTLPALTDSLKGVEVPHPGVYNHLPLQNPTPKGDTDTT